MELKSLKHPALAPAYARIAELSALPLWEILGDVVGEAPVPLGVPHVWRYAEMRPLLLDAGARISAAEAERRVLALKNPALDRPGISQTLFAGLQLVMPGEVAPAHRHAAGALRFVLESGGGYSAVEGERCLMRRGDLITTPSWTWHDHENTGDAPMIWLDGLDVPMVNFFGTPFGEEHPDDQQPILRPDDASVARWGSGMRPYGEVHGHPWSPILSYPYDRSRAALMGASRSGTPHPQHGYKMTYANPMDGGHILPTIAAFLQFLPAGFETAPWRSTEATVLVAVEGEGTALVGGAEIAFAASDVIVAPNWTTLRLQAACDTVLFSFSDRAAQQRLGFWREDRNPVV
ncbi:MAG: cupin domain-containing protein [Gemmobacter sp.]